MVQTRSQKRKLSTKDSTAINNTKTKSDTENSSSIRMGTAGAFYKDINEFWGDVTNFVTLGPMFVALGPLDVNKFDFNGFNCQDMITDMMANAVAAKKSKSDFFRDIIDMIVIGLSRGNVRKDQVDRTVAEGGPRINELATVYKIPMRDNAKQSLSAAMIGNSLTFGRSIAAFPHLASLILHKSPRMVRDVFRSTLDVQSLPNCMKHSGFSALIPSTVNVTIQSMFLYASTAYMIDFSRMLNNNLRTTPTADLYHIQSKFTKIAQDKSMYSETARMNYLIGFNLHSADNFNRILDVASKLYTEVTKQVLDVTGIRNAFVKENAILMLDSAASQTNALTSANTMMNSLTITERAPAVATLQGVTGTSGPVINFL
nr:putative capsid protein [Qingdao RNA virus 3]